jgi:hypothetical protein
MKSSSPMTQNYDGWSLTEAELDTATRLSVVVL